MTEAEFYDRCATHDWSYYFSDDHRHYLAGRRNWEALEALAIQHGWQVQLEQWRTWWRRVVAGERDAPRPPRPSAQETPNG